MDTEAADKHFKKYTEDADAVFDVNRAKLDYAKAKVEMELDNERWKNRRRMAWLAMWAMIAATLAMFTIVPESKIELLDEIVAWFMMAMASIVGTYIGTATWAQVSSARRPKVPSYIESTPWDNYGQGRLNSPVLSGKDAYEER